jgi:hypothetical protein
VISIAAVSCRSAIRAIPSAVTRSSAQMMIRLDAFPASLSPSSASTSWSLAASVASTVPSTMTPASAAQNDTAAIAREPSSSGTAHVERQRTAIVT